MLTVESVVGDGKVVETTMSSTTCIESSGSGNRCRIVVLDISDRMKLRSYCVMDDDGQLILASKTLSLQ